MPSSRRGRADIGFAVNLFNFTPQNLKNDLFDELRLKIFPINLGRDKRLFAEGTIPVDCLKVRSHQAGSSLPLTCAQERSRQDRLRTKTQPRQKPPAANGLKRGNNMARVILGVQYPWTGSPKIAMVARGIRSRYTAK